MSHYAGCPKNNNLYAICECERIEIREHTIQLERSNNLVSSTDALSALIQDRDEWKSMVEATAKGAEEARSQLESSQAECERLKEIRAKFVMDHLNRICGECGHDKDDEGNAQNVSPRF